MASRSKRWGQFSCTPGDRVTMYSCIRVGPSSVVAIGPSAVSTVVAISTSGSYRERLARHCPNEALHLGLVVVIVHAGADERVDSARGQIEPRQPGLMDVDVHGAQPVACLARRFAILEKGDDSAQLHSVIVDNQAGLLRELPPQQRTERFDP